jgi:hypothetical protein
MKYTRGPVTTDIIWNKPSVQAIKAWHNDMKLVIERSGYTAYLTGRSLTNITVTNDVDIVYTGELKPDTLEQLLITSLVTGFRHKILVDARWQNAIETAEYRDNKLTILPTKFAFLNYYEQDNEMGYKVVNDFRLNPQYKAVNENIVSSTFNSAGHRLKPHLLDYITKYGKFPSVLLTDYNKE